MGGIVSKVSFDSHETVATAVLEQMLDASAGSRDAARRMHRAPGIVLAACTDTAVSRSGAVATGTREGLFACADAHLTNTATLRTQLADLGHHVDGLDDDALILRAYEEWGLTAFTRLRGPFACAIWNSTTRRLVVARDHLGIQPIYFAVLPDHGVIVASHTRALLRDPDIRRDWCPAAIDAYLALGYVPAPLSPYQCVSKLEAGHALTIDGPRVHVESYWDLPAPARTAGSEPEVVAAIGAQLRRTVAGPDGAGTGLLYSGGTASTALLSVSPVSGPIVTAAFDRDAGDLVRSGHAAGLLGHTRELQITAPDITAAARQLAASCDEPVADPSAIDQLAACLAMRRHAPRARAAHGTATLWADHARHHVEQVEALARTFLVWPLKTMTGGLGRSLPGAVKGARALSHLGMPPASACAVKQAYGLWENERRRNLYTRGFAWEVRDRTPFARHLELYDRCGADDALARALYVDVRTFLPDSVLAMAMGAARAADLELRFPMLDVDFVEYVAALPMRVRRRGPHGMYGLRSMLAGALPAGLLPPARRTPARHAWLPSALAALVPPLLLGARFDERGIVSRPALRRLWHEHVSGRGRHAHRLWSLVSLELWLRHVIDGDADERPLEYAILTSRRAGAALRVA